MPKRNRYREARSESRAYLDVAFALRTAEIKKYARTMNNGNVMYCKSSLSEDRQRSALGKKPIRSKIIFNNIDDAKTWAGILFKKTGVKRRAYLCPRSNHGHAHLTTKL